MYAQSVKAPGAVHAVLLIDTSIHTSPFALAIKSLSITNSHSSLIDEIQENPWDYDKKIFMNMFDGIIY